MGVFPYLRTRVRRVWLRSGERFVSEALLGQRHHGAHVHAIDVAEAVARAVRALAFRPVAFFAHAGEVEGDAVRGDVGADFLRGAVDRGAKIFGRGPAAVLREADPEIGAADAAGARGHE